MIFRNPVVQKVLKGLQIAFIMVWLSNLASTDAYFSVYVLIGFFSFYCLLKSDERTGMISAKHRSVLVFGAFLFSAAALAANYLIFTQVRDLERIQYSTNRMLNILNTLFSFIGGIAASYPILCRVYSAFPVEQKIVPRSDRDKRFYLFNGVVFCLITGIYLIHLFLVEYPGNITEDTFTQIGEMYAGEYSNFNTFWHTMFLQGILSVGYSLFGDVNAAIACVCAVQALIAAATFTYCLSTLYIAGIPKGYLTVAFLVYAVLPYNIALSITPWKDVLLGVGALLFAAALLRILFSIGTRKLWNHILLILGGLLLGLAKNNGLYILGAATLVLLVVLRKNPRAAAVITGVFALCWVLCNPVLDALGVSGSDYTESLSIPLQQVSRVIADGCELNEEETELISRILDIEDVPSLYTNWLSDPIKVEFREHDLAYFEENTGAYAKLYIRLGLKHPGSYFRAWVDQTKGYWNGGYPYAMYSETVTDNPYGVVKADQGNIIARLFGLYFGLSRHVIFFEPLHSIGLHVWILILCTVINILKKRRSAVLSVPLLILVLGLWCGTPVYASFRYVYPIFITLPLIAASTMYSVETKG